MADTKWSQFPSATPGNSDEVVGLHSGGNVLFSIANIVAAVRNGLENIFVPKTDVGAAGGVASLDNTGKVPASQLPSSTGPEPATATPLMDGTGAVGTSLKYAREDHEHPANTNKQSKITASGILMGDGAGGVSAATAGTDYQAPLTAGTDYATPAQLADKANQTQLAYVESGTTASQNYTAGQYICWRGLLYTADTAIASGATFYTSGGNKNLTECVGGGFNKLAPVFGTWTPNSNASAVVADRCFYMISGGFLLVSIAIVLVNSLSNHAEVDIISNLPETFGRTLRTNAVFSTAAMTFYYNGNSKPIRVQIGNNKLYIRNDSGSSLTSNDIIYSQIVIPVY